MVKHRHIDSVHPTGFLVSWLDFLFYFEGHISSTCYFLCDGCVVNQASSLDSPTWLCFMLTVVPAGYSSAVCVKVELLFLVLPAHHMHTARSSSSQALWCFSFSPSASHPPLPVCSPTLLRACQSVIRPRCQLSSALTSTHLSFLDNR